MPWVRALPTLLTMVVVDGVPLKGLTTVERLDSCKPSMLLRNSAMLKPIRPSASAALKPASTDWIFSPSNANTLSGRPGVVLKPPLLLPRAAWA